jgi:hypothetical protein
MHDNASSPQTPKLLPLAARLAGVVVAVALSTMLADAAPDSQSLFIVNQPWVKPGVRATEAYMNLTSTEGATLIGVRSPIAAQAALRGPGAHGRVRAFLALPAGSAVALRPGSDHVALTGLARALKPGERVALTLLVETAAGMRQEIAIDAEVRNESPLDAERHAHRH